MRRRRAGPALAVALAVLALLCGAAAVFLVGRLDSAVPHSTRGLIVLLVAVGCAAAVPLLGFFAVLVVRLELTLRGLVVREHALLGVQQGRAEASAPRPEAESLAQAARGVGILGRVAALAVFAGGTGLLSLALVARSGQVHLAEVWDSALWIVLCLAVAAWVTWRAAGFCQLVGEGFVAMVHGQSLVMTLLDLRDPESQPGS